MGNDSTRHTRACLLSGELFPTGLCRYNGPALIGEPPLVRLKGSSHMLIERNKLCRRNTSSGFGGKS